MMTASLRFNNSYSHVCMLLMAVVVLEVMETGGASAIPTITVESPSSLAAVENALALRMLRAYVERLREGREQIVEPEDYANGYVLIEDLKSIKRATGPRPLRFG